jgi:hypothetical protein
MRHETVAGPATRRTSAVKARRSRRLGGGVAGNEHLTSLPAAVLLVLLAVEGATIPFLHRHGHE